MYSSVDLNTAGLIAGGALSPVLIAFPVIVIVIVMTVVWSRQ